ncbi:MAG TPA: alpha/beta hydrolase [Pirellulales bacterium]|nr:alpha/beta hydrolase [Pirellulales bacterium]
MESLIPFVRRRSSVATSATFVGLVVLLAWLSGGRLANAERKYIEQHDVLYATAAEQPLRCDVYVPAGEGPFPGVLLVHGGAWMSGNKGHMSRIGAALAEHGYTACSIDYRLAPKHLFPAQIDDCKTAVRWFRAHANLYKLDPAHLGGYGYSAGGQLVALLAVTDADDGLEGADAPADAPSTRLQCAVAGGASCDFRSLPADSGRLAYWLGGSRAEKPQLYTQASPLNFVTADDPPSFFFHGETDGLVPLASPRRMVEQLSASRVPAVLHTVAGAGHIDAFFNVEAMTAAIGFLDRYLRPAPKDAEPSDK